MKAVLEYWQSLKEQEQKLLMVAGGIFVIFVFVMGVWRPLNNAIESSTKELKKQQDLSIWMQSSIAKIKKSNIAVLIETQTTTIPQISGVEMVHLRP